VDRESNTLTVKRHGGEELSYDPRRLQGVTVYRDSERKFAQGDRVQVTAPYHEQKLANRELATIERIGGDGNLKLSTDSGREIEFNARQHPHLDYGYAVTSHSSQGQTADRVLTSVVTSNPANGGHPKTGQWNVIRTSHSFTLPGHFVQGWFTSFRGRVQNRTGW
jgi:hypothetical protein